MNSSDFQHHSRPINCMTYDIFDSSKLVTTSYDGTCRIFDINEKKSSVIYGDPEDDQFTTYHAQVDRDCFLVTLGKTGQCLLKFLARMIISPGLDITLG